MIIEETMRKIILVRIAGVVTLTLLVAVFAHLYGIMQANWLRYGLKISLQNLPIPTTFYDRYSFLGYALPIAAALTFFVGRDARQNRRPHHIEAVLWVIGVLALAWLLACILAWQLPVYYPISTIH
jgi:hypothetical protein